MINKLLGYFSKDIGIDLGTANTLVYVRGRGINEPSVVAVNQKTGQIVAIGNDAKKMVGRTPAYITATRPLVEGVISDFDTTEEMLRYFIQKVHKETFSLFPRPRVVIGIPSEVTEVERRAVEDAARNAGAREVYLIEEPMAAAIGVRLPVQEAIGSLVVDIGGGTSDIAVISLGGIVAANSVKVAGNKFDQAISDYIKKHYNLAIGDRTAEEVKIKIGSAIPLDDTISMEIKGRDLMTGLPRTIEIFTTEVTKAISYELDEVIRAIKKVLHDTPPELAADIIERGIVMSGGSSLLRNIGELVLQETGVPAHIADEALLCVAKGTGIALEHLDVYKRSISSKR